LPPINRKTVKLLRTGTTEMRGRNNRGKNVYKQLDKNSLMEESDDLQNSDGIPYIPPLFSMV